jgi:hypothetical protein
MKDSITQLGESRWVVDSTGQEFTATEEEIMNGGIMRAVFPDGSNFVATEEAMKAAIGATYERYYDRTALGLTIALTLASVLLWIYNPLSWYMLVVGLLTLGSWIHTIEHFIGDFNGFVLFCGMLVFLFGWIKEVF